MFDFEEFNKKLKELNNKCKLPEEEVGKLFSNRAIRDLSIDIADMIKGINPFLQKSFESFYNNIGCMIFSNQFNTRTIQSSETVDDLYNIFKHITPKVTISLRFFFAFVLVDVMSEGMF